MADALSGRIAANLVAHDTLPGDIASHVNACRVAQLRLSSAVRRPLGRLTFLRSHSAICANSSRQHDAYRHPEFTKRAS